MADDDQNLVSQVQITGTDESTKALQDFAEKGGKAFDDLADHAKKASDSVKKSSDDIAGAGRDAADGLGQVAKTDISAKASASAKQLDAISAAMEGLTSHAIKVGKELAKFATRVVGLTTAAAAAGAGIAALAASVVKSQNTQTSAFEETNKAQQATVAANLTATQASINFQAQQAVLNRQLAQGKITYDQYSDTLKSNRDAYNDQIKVTRQLEAAQEDARLETERLQKTLADRKAYTALIETYGGPLTSSLLALGNTVAGIKNKFIDAFGPSMAAAIDVVVNTLSSSASSISNFFGSLSGKFNAFITQNGPAIQQALQSIGTAVAAVFNGLIDALPSLLDLFNNQLVPAFRVIADLANSLTQSFNNIFGTNFTTGAAVILLALTSLTGGFKLLIGTIGLVIEAFRLFGALNAVTSMFSPLTLAVVALVAAGVLLYRNWGTIVQGLSDLWNGLVKTVGDGVAAIVKFFADLPGTVSDLFTAVGSAIKAAFITAFDTVKAYVVSWVTAIKEKLQPIIDEVKFLASFLGGSSGDDTSNAAPAFAGGGGVRGPGTSTSDSILAWLSNNEFVIRAKAVRKYGSAFLQAINSGSLDLSKIGRYAVGGLVTALSPSPFPAGSRARPEPSFSGGPAGILNLTIGEQTFKGLVVPDQETANSLTRYVTQRRLTSGGRKPSWKGN